MTAKPTALCRGDPPPSGIDEAIAKLEQEGGGPDTRGTGPDGGSVDN